MQASFSDGFSSARGFWSFDGLFSAVSADFMAFVAPDEWAADTICIKSLRAPIPQSVVSASTFQDNTDKHVATAT
eukprot:3937358-Rhodomonas_salina.2